MRVDRQTGYARLAIVFILFSALLWGSLITKATFDLNKAKTSYSYYGYVLKQFVESNFKDAWMTPQEIKEAHEEAAARLGIARNWLWLLIEIAIAAFVLPPLILVSTTWIYRGFKISN